MELCLKTTTFLTRVLVFVVLLLSSCIHAPNNTAKTLIHREGYCSMYGYCGENDKGKVPCPRNKPAERINESLAQKIALFCPYLWKNISARKISCCTEEMVTNTYNSTIRASNLLGGCPACWNNFANLWCTISCSPDQSLFMDVVKTQRDKKTKLVAVKKVNFYFTEDFKDTLYNSCKEVQFSAANMPAMSFFGNPQNADEFLSFLGTPPQKQGEAPYALSFRHENNTPSEMVAHAQELPNCGSLGYECSCADCSSADYCKMVQSEKDESESSCKGPLRCYEYGIIAAGLAVLVLVIWIIWFSPFEQSMQDISLLDDSSDHSYEMLHDDNDDDEYHAVLLEGETIRYPPIERWLRQRFETIGVFIAVHPYLIILISLSIIGLVSIGNVNYQLETTPQGLWTPKDSRADKEKNKYDAAFGPYYRVENLIVRTTSDSPSHGLSATGMPRIVSYNNIELMFNLQDIVDSIEARVEDENQSYTVKLTDVCYKTLGVCVVESVLQYWQMDKNQWDSLFKQSHQDVPKEDRALFFADHCFQHWTNECRSNFQAPVDPKIVLGGFPLNEDFRSYINDTTAFVVTYLLDSDKRNEKAALAWEKEFIKTAKHKITEIVKAAGLEVSFMAERSTEDELDRETYMDAVTIIVSYLVMFGYVALSLTFLTKRHQSTSPDLFVQSHVIVGLLGICIVVLSVIGAIGIISILDIKVSLIVLEVIPFLVLAIGVDNMFILANELRSLDPALPISVRVGSALAEVGPSITCAATAEATAFGLAAIAPIPAVRTFSLCAFFAVLLDFFLQCTLFTAFLVLDTIRRESNRVDCVPCLQLGPKMNQPEPEYVVREIGTPSQQSDIELPENILQRAVNQYYIPFLFAANRRWVHFIILTLTVIMLFVSIVLIGRMERGLAEQVAFPRDSYLQDYFTEGLPLMRVGAPLMFVVNNLNVSNQAKQVEKICGIHGCNYDSLVSQIDLAASTGKYHLASPASSWIDDFQRWFNTPNCCRTHGNSTSLCPYDDENPDCTSCSVFKLGDLNKYELFLPGFMAMSPDETCPRGGKSAFEDYIQHELDNSSAIIGLDHQIVQASSFRTYYSPLVAQSDYIDALSDSNKFADELSKSLDMDIYAYSVFHVFFQQYLHIVKNAVLMITLAIVAAFLVCWFLLSSLKVALLVLICVAMIVVDLVGASYIADVKLNGVSVVNMTMAVGIAVEFCVHLAHSFLMLPGSRLGRVSSALRGVGLSVISGIAITKFVGVFVLIFATTKLFKIYYFRMYMALVLLGAWHGLVVLPVLLALFGPMSRVTRVPITTTTTLIDNDSNRDKEEHPPLVPQTSQSKKPMDA
eukprot:g3716.t1